MTSCIVEAILNSMYLQNCDGEYYIMDFKKVYEKQGENQREMLKLGMYDKSHCSESTYRDMYNVELPIDDIRLASYHIQQLMSEVGELLDADKSLSSECFVELDKADIVKSKTCHLKSFRNSVDRAHAHETRIAACCADTDDPCDRLYAKLSSFLA